MSNKTAMNSLSVVTRGIAKTSRRCEDHHVALPRALRKPVVLSCGGSLSAPLPALQARCFLGEQTIDRTTCRPTSNARRTVNVHSSEMICSRLPVYSASVITPVARSSRVPAGVGRRRLRWCLRRGHHLLAGRRRTCLADCLADHVLDANSGESGAKANESADAPLKAAWEEAFRPLPSPSDFALAHVDDPCRGRRAARSGPACTLGPAPTAGSARPTSRVQPRFLHTDSVCGVPGLHLGADGAAGPAFLARRNGDTVAS